MKKAIGAFVSGLLLSGVAAALYEMIRKNGSLAAGQQRQSSARADDSTEQLTGADQHRPVPERQPAQELSGLLDLNECSATELASLEGMDADAADRIIEGRPYRNKLDLLSRMIVPEVIYVEISHYVTASDPGESVKVAS
jgi:DNA uptake protein ComE-like DNA-binding protein